MTMTTTLAMVSDGGKFAKWRRASAHIRYKGCDAGASSSLHSRAQHNVFNTPYIDILPACLRSCWRDDVAHNGCDSMLCVVCRRDVARVGASSDGAHAKGLTEQVGAHATRGRKMCEFRVYNAYYVVYICKNMYTYPETHTIEYMVTYFFHTFSLQYLTERLVAEMKRNLRGKVCPKGLLKNHLERVFLLCGGTRCEQLHDSMTGSIMESVFAAVSRATRPIQGTIRIVRIILCKTPNRPKGGRIAVSHQTSYMIAWVHSAFGLVPLARVSCGKFA